VIRRNVVADNWNCNIYVDTGLDTIVDGNLVYLSGGRQVVAGCAQAQVERQPRRWLDNATSRATERAKAEGKYGIQALGRLQGPLVNNIVVGTKVAVRSWPYGGGEAFRFHGLGDREQTVRELRPGIHLRPNPTSKDATIRNNLVIQRSGRTSSTSRTAISDPSPSPTTCTSGPARFEWRGKPGDFADWVGMRRTPIPACCPTLRPAA